jgi:hypothetical protein
MRHGVYAHFVVALLEEHDKREAPHHHRYAIWAVVSPLRKDVRFCSYGLEQVLDRVEEFLPESASLGFVPQRRGVARDAPN